jgi:hypothetical protein
MKQRTHQERIAGTTFECHCARMERTCQGEAATLEMCRCPDFLWTQGPAVARTEAGETPLWAVEIEDFGNKKDGLQRNLQ